MGRMLLLPRRGWSTRRIYKRAFPDVQKPEGMVRIYRNRSWRVYAERGCAPPRAQAAPSQLRSAASR